MSCSLLTCRRSMICWALCVLAALFWPAPAAHAEKQVSCVRCASPDQTYRCNVMSEDDVRPDALRYFCMSQIAREHVHESCTVLRGAASCVGVEVSYVYQDGVDDQASGASAGSSGVAEGKKEPGTLAEMTRPAVDASVKAGQAVGEATKRTLKCLGSALNGC